MLQTRLVIREATECELNEAACVVEAAFAPLRPVYRPVGAAAARQAERFREGVRLVADLDGRIVGTVQYADHTRHVHIIGLAVDPLHQRQGVARRMIDRVVALAPSLGHRVVVLDTIKETGNVPLFEHLGFRVASEAVSVEFASEVYDQLHEVKMQRVL